MKSDLRIEELDLTNAFGKVLSQVKEHSRVLECGCATGYMTRYMKEKLSCDVCIVEKDQEAFDTARPYAAGGICADLMEDDWLGAFEEKAFDYVLLTDVLEYLYTPKEVLKKAVRFLKDDGKMIVSLPNVAHNDILLKLFAEHWDYTPTGLLDDTRIRFWAYNNLGGVFSNTGLSITIFDATIVKTTQTEQYNGIQCDVNPAYLNMLKQRRTGEVYQFILTLQRDEYVQEHGIETRNLIPDHGEVTSESIESISQYKQALKRKDDEIYRLQEEKTQGQTRIREIEKEKRQILHDLGIANYNLGLIYASGMYKLSLKYYRVRDAVLPVDSARYRMAKATLNTFKKVFSGIGERRRDKKRNPIDKLHEYGQYSRMDVIATKHTRFIAELIKRQLDRLSIACEIHIGEPERYEDIPYVIVCPQFVKRFPAVYFVFQMEQTVSSRWFTEEYIRSLQNSCAILDYSLENVEFFHRPQNRDLTKKVYYLPVDYYPQYWTSSEAEKEYDVVFYGDVNNCERRQKMLAEVAKRFKVKVCSELFGEELYREISKAKVLVNIHYYEDALLETTRLYETLSLNTCMIVSESSKDKNEIERLQDFVDFVPIDDVEAMIERIAYWLDNEEEREKKIAQNKTALENRSNAFDFFFNRFLLAFDRISFDTFYRNAGSYVKLDTNRICLSLPESTERRRSFDKDNLYGFECVPGLRHELGWVGCGLSYKLIFTLALEAGMSELMICEDDVIFPENFEKRMREILSYLHAQKKWSIFSGVMADVGDVNIRGCTQADLGCFLEIDHMVSMVFNIYHREVFAYFVDWNEQNRDVQKNTIDRYLEQKDLSVHVQVPYLVGHKEELDSTIWGISNTEYAAMIDDSEEKLKELLRAYLERKDMED